MAQATEPLLADLLVLKWDYKLAGGKAVQKDSRMVDLKDAR